MIFDFFLSSPYFESEHSLNCEISASATYLGLPRCLGTLTTFNCIFLCLSRFLGASTTISNSDPTILCVPGNSKPQPFDKVAGNVKPSSTPKFELVDDTK